MIKLAITGNAASGKSTAAACLTRHGVGVCDADALAHALLTPGTSEYRAVLERFGQGVVKTGGEIDRAALGRIVFADPAALAELNGMLHPGVMRSWKTWTDRRPDDAVTALQAPQLFEAGLETGWDAVLCVCASRAVRLQRLSKRGLSPSAIEQRMASQWPQGIKAEQSDFVIWNDDGMEILSRQVDEVLACIKMMI